MVVHIYLPLDTTLKPQNQQDGNQLKHKRYEKNKNGIIFAFNGYIEFFYIWIN